MTEHDAFVDAAAALLIASITMRDLADAMPSQFMVGMPDDIRDRVVRPGYQEAFDALPEQVKREACTIVDADPAIIAARQL